MKLWLSTALDTALVECSFSHYLQYGIPSYVSLIFSRIFSNVVPREAFKVRQGKNKI